MYITATQYSLNHKALEIYFTGCKAPHCPGCHNPELQPFVLEENIDEKLNEIKQKIKDFPLLVENIVLLGGEPLDQMYLDFKIFMDVLYKQNKPIWLFTKYEIDRIPRYIKERCAYIKTGRYLFEYPDGKKYPIGEIEHGYQMASDNQHVHKKGKDY